MVAIVTDKFLTQIQIMTTPMEGNMAILSPETMIAFTNIAPLCNFWSTKFTTLTSYWLIYKFPCKDINLIKCNLVSENWNDICSHINHRTLQQLLFCFERGHVFVLINKIYGMIKLKVRNMKLQYKRLNLILFYK